MIARPTLYACLIAVTLAAAALPASAGESASTSNAGSAGGAPGKLSGLQTLPAFTLPDLEGKSHASKNWQGKVVLVDFWATWCAGCRQTIPALARLQEKFGPQGLSVVGISLDKGSKSKVAKFARKLKVNYLVLLDSEDTLSKTFGFEGLPSLYLFDRQGKLLKSMAGYSALHEKELEALVAAQFPAQP